MSADRELAIDAGATERHDGLDLVIGARRWRLRSGRTLSVGRAIDCDIRVDDQEVSRRHAEVLLDARDGWLLRDCGSKNGLVAEGRRVTSVPLHAGTVVTLGQSPQAPLLRVESATDHAGGAGRRETVVVGRSDGSPLTIGRDGGNALVVDDLLASRHHARATPAGDGFWVEDLGSLNGTYVNGAPISAAQVSPKDILAIGHLQFHVVDGQLVLTTSPSSGTLQADQVEVVLPGGKQLLAGVSFSLNSSSLLGVIGPSGAGKSTLLHALTGGRRATAGQVLFEGRDLYQNYPELRHRIGVVPQDDVVHSQLTVRQALGYASELRFPADLDPSARRSRIAEVMTELGLEEHADTRIDRLSGGQRKRTSVALELLTEPNLLFLDEPTSGLDPGLDKSVMATLRGLADGGRTVVVITHSVSSLDLCDEVLLLAPGGTAAYFGPPSGLLGYFGRDDYADVFTDVALDPVGVSARFRGRDSGTNRPSIQGPTQVAHPAPPPQRQQPIRRQLSTLVRRQARVMIADRSYMLFMALLPLVLAALAAVVPGEGGFGPPGPPPTSEPLQLLVIVLVGAAFMGAAATARDLVVERPIYRRELAVGLSPAAYLGAKLVVFAVLSAIQSVLLVGLVAALKHGPDSASALGAGWIELLAAVALTCFCSATLGLLLSASVATSEQVMPLLVVLIMAQLVLCGGLIPIDDRAGLQQLASLAPSRWGFAAGASTVDLLNKILTPHDELWRHSWDSWATAIAALFVLTALFAAATALRLRKVGRN